MTPRSITARPSTPSPRLGTGEPAGGLPADLQADATRRLGVACLVYAGVALLDLVFNNVIAPWISPDRVLDDAFPWPGNPVAIGIIVCSLLLYGYLRRSGYDREVALNLGL